MNLRKDHDSIYIKYHRLPPYAWHRKIAFYQEHRPDFLLVNKSERREIEIDYLNALFEVGKYERFLTSVDPIIEAVIEENIYSYGGKDIYANLLFRKAACLYNLDRPRESIAISRQLIGINKKEKTYKHLLAKAKFRLGRKWYDIIFASSIFFLLLAICSYLLEEFVIDPFYAMHLATIIKVKYALFGMFAILLLTNEVVHRAKMMDFRF